MGKEKKKYFVVWDGHVPGIYTSWPECQKQVKGYAAAKFMGFPSLNEATEAYNSPYYDFVGKNAKAKKQANPLLIQEYGVPELESLSVDAACSGSPGIMEYRGVYTRTGEEIFKMGPFPLATNNMGEFLALVHGLALLKKENKNMPIYSDSITAMKWVKDKKYATKLEPSESSRQVFELMDRAVKWLLNNEYSTPVFKWETKAWGEIPADFGRK